jgi:hypothetical protein
VCVCGFCNVWVCVCVGFVMCGCVCVCGFFNVWVCVRVGFYNVCVTSPTGGGRSVGIVRSRTKATEFSLV